MSATQSQCFFLWCFGVSLDRNFKRQKARMYAKVWHMRWRKTQGKCTDFYILYSVFIVLFSLSNYLQNTVLIGCFLQSSLVCLAAKNFNNFDSVQLREDLSSQYIHPLQLNVMFAVTCTIIIYLQHETCTNLLLYFRKYLRFFYTVSSLKRYLNWTTSGKVIFFSNFCTFQARLYFLGMKQPKGGDWNLTFK